MGCSVLFESGRSSFCVINSVGCRLAKRVVLFPLFVLKLRGEVLGFSELRFLSLTSSTLNADSLTISSGALDSCDSRKVHSGIVTVTISCFYSCSENRFGIGWIDSSSSCENSPGVVTCLCKSKQSLEGTSDILTTVDLVSTCTTGATFYVSLYCGFIPEAQLSSLSRAWVCTCDVAWRLPSPIMACEFRETFLTSMK
jgi:hypothetical protein